MRPPLVLALGLLAAALGACGSGAISLAPARALEGWHVSSKTSHGTGGRWVSEQGVILGTQDKPGNGGLLITDAQFGDYEISLEMKNDYGPDSGLFLRCTEDGKAYQAMIDYHRDGNLMGLYGEGIGSFVAKNFDLLESPDTIQIRDYPTFPCPFTPDQWKRGLWKAGDWNELRARIVGNPPRIQTWINGIQVMDFRDSQRRLPDRGGIGLQLHGKENSTGRYVRYRNVRVTPLGD